MQKNEFSQQVFSDETLHSFLINIAERMGQLRKLTRIQYLVQHINDIRSDASEMAHDWHNATIYFASLILEGREIQLTLLESSSYHYLENIWLDEFKQMKAYNLWQETRIENSERNYYEACEYVRQLFLHQEKYSLEHFNKVSEYLNENYLSLGKIDEKKSSTQNLIRTKAERIYRETAISNLEDNWLTAKFFVTNFYENIVTAVQKEDKDSIMMVLAAFKANRSIINCFEFAIVVYFFNKRVLTELLNIDNIQEYI